MKSGSDPRELLKIESHLEAAIVKQESAYLDRQFKIIGEHLEKNLGDRSIFSIDDALQDAIVALKTGDPNKHNLRHLENRDYHQGLHQKTFEEQATDLFKTLPIEDPDKNQFFSDYSIIPEKDNIRRMQLVLIAEVMLDPLKPLQEYKKNHDGKLVEVNSVESGKIYDSHTSGLLLINSREDIGYLSNSYLPFITRYGALVIEKDILANAKILNNLINHEQGYAKVHTKAKTSDPVVKEFTRLSESIAFRERELEKNPKTVKEAELRMSMLTRVAAEINTSIEKLNSLHVDTTEIKKFNHRTEDIIFAHVNENLSLLQEHQLFSPSSSSSRSLASSSLRSLGSSSSSLSSPSVKPDKSSTSEKSKKSRKRQ